MEDIDRDADEAYTITNADIAADLIGLGCSLLSESGLWWLYRRHAEQLAHGWPAEDRDAVSSSSTDPNGVLIRRLQIILFPASGEEEMAICCRDYRADSLGQTHLPGSSTPMHGIAASLHAWIKDIIAISVDLKAHAVPGLLGRELQKDGHTVEDSGPASVVADGGREAPMDDSEPPAEGEEGVLPLSEQSGRLRYPDSSIFFAAAQLAQVPADVVQRARIYEEVAWCARGKDHRNRPVKQLISGAHLQHAELHVSWGISDRLRLPE